MEYKRKKMSSISVLKQLPDVFTHRDVKILLNLEKEYISIYCHRWVKSGLIKSLGPKAGVYYNLIVNPNGPEELIKKAVDKLGKEVIVIGLSSLHQHGWTTQRPQQIEIAVPVNSMDKTFPILDGFNVFKRSHKWFSAVYNKSEIGINQFMTLSPELALIDILKEKGKNDLWFPDPSDIDIPYENQENVMDNLKEACNLLNMDINLYNDFFSKIEGLENNIIKI